MDWLVSMSKAGSFTTTHPFLCPNITVLTYWYIKTPLWHQERKEPTNTWVSQYEQKTKDLENNNK